MSEFTEQVLLYPRSAQLVGFGQELDAGVVVE